MMRSSMVTVARELKAEEMELRVGDKEEDRVGTIYNNDNTVGVCILLIHGWQTEPSVARAGLSRWTDRQLDRQACRQAGRLTVR